MKYFSKALDDFLQEIPKYPQHLENVTVKDKTKIMKDIRIENLTKKYQSVEGFRIIVRPSGTEAKLRIMTEGSKPRFLNDYFRIIYRRIELHT